jgi:O-antigen/teichoic acid export membrane protein
VLAPDAAAGRRGMSAAARSAGPVAVAGILVNLVVAGTTLAVARQLNSREYGTFVQLVAVFYVLTMPGLALGIAVVRRVSAWLVRAERQGSDGIEPGALDAWVSRVRRQVWVGSAAAAAVGAAISLPFAHLLVIRSPGGLIETFVAGGLWTVVCFERALLQARQAYPPYATNLAVEGVLRCAVTIVAVAAGLGVPGAAAGLLVSLPVAVVHARRAQARVPARPAAAVGDSAVGIRAARARRDALLALAALGLLAVLQNVDVLVLGRRIPSSSGSYGAVSVACKALVLVAFVLAGFLLPEAATRRAAGHHALSSLGVSLAFIAVPSALLVGAALAAGRPLLSLAFGQRLASASAAFTPLALAMALLAASVMLTHYLLAAGSRPVIGVLLVAALLTTVVLALAGSTPARVAWTDAAAQGALTLALGCLVAFHHRAASSR